MQAVLSCQLADHIASSNNSNFEEGIEDMLAVNLKVEDLSQALKLFAKKEFKMPESLVPRKLVKPPVEGFNKMTLDQKIEVLKSTGAHLEVEVAGDSIKVPSHSHEILNNRTTSDPFNSFTCDRIAGASVCMSGPSGM